MDDMLLLQILDVLKDCRNSLSHIEEQLDPHRQYDNIRNSVTDTLKEQARKKR